MSINLLAIFASDMIKRRKPYLKNFYYCLSVLLECKLILSFFFNDDDDLSLLYFKRVIFLVDGSFACC